MTHVKPLWGVFRWEAQNVYRPIDALRVYKRRSAAVARSERDDAIDLVVRSIDPGHLERQRAQLERKANK